MEGISLLDSSLEIEKTESVLPAPDHGEVLLGRLEAIDESGNALVSFFHLPRSPQCIALSTVPVQPRHVGRQVALMFTHGVKPKPILMGFIHSPLQQVLDVVLENTIGKHQQDESVFSETSVVTTRAVQKNSESSIFIDGKQLVLEGQEEIVLRCGDASITLDRTGKISIRGKYVLSRATGVNRILGGSVQVN